MTLKMDRAKRDELDILIEGVLEDVVSDEAPPDRVWANISLELQERQRSQAKFEYLRLLRTEIAALGGDIVAGARMMLTPCTHGGEEGWTQRLVVSGYSSASPLYSIHH